MFFICFLLQDEDEEDYDVVNQDEDLRVAAVDQRAVEVSDAEEVDDLMVEVGSTDVEAVVEETVEQPVQETEERTWLERDDEPKHETEVQYAVLEKGSPRWRKPPWREEKWVQKCGARRKCKNVACEFESFSRGVAYCCTYCGAEDAGKERHIDFDRLKSEDGHANHCKRRVWDDAPPAVPSIGSIADESGEDIEVTAEATAEAKEEATAEPSAQATALEDVPVVALDALGPQASLRVIVNGDMEYRAESLCIASVVDARKWVEEGTWATLNEYVGHVCTAHTAVLLVLVGLEADVLEVMRGLAATIASFRVKVYHAPYRGVSAADELNTRHPAFANTALRMAVGSRFDVIALKDADAFNRFMDVTLLERYVAACEEQNDGCTLMVEAHEHGEEDPKYHVLPCTLTAYSAVWAAMNYIEETTTTAVPTACGIVRMFDGHGINLYSPQPQYITNVAALADGCLMAWEKEFYARRGAKKANVDRPTIGLAARRCCADLVVTNASWLPVLLTSETLPPPRKDIAFQYLVPETKLRSYGGLKGLYEQELAATHDENFKGLVRVVSKKQGAKTESKLVKRQEADKLIQTGDWTEHLSRAKKRKTRYAAVAAAKAEPIIPTYSN